MSWERRFTPSLAVDRAISVRELISRRVWLPFSCHCEEFRKGCLLELRTEYERCPGDAYEQDIQDNNKPEPKVNLE